MKSLNLNIMVDENGEKMSKQFCKSPQINTNTVYEKLKKAEDEMNNTSKRYSKKEILESMNNIIG